MVNFFWITKLWYHYFTAHFLQDTCLSKNYLPIHYCILKANLYIYMRVCARVVSCKSTVSVFVNYMHQVLCAGWKNYTNNCEMQVFLSESSLIFTAERTETLKNFFKVWWTVTLSVCKSTMFRCAKKHTTGCALKSSKSMHSHSSRIRRRLQKVRLF